MSSCSLRLKNMVLLLERKKIHNVWHGARRSMRVLLTHVLNETEIGKCLKRTIYVHFLVHLWTLHCCPVWPDRDRGHFTKQLHLTLLLLTFSYHIKCLLEKLSAILRVYSDRLFIHHPFSSTFHFLNVFYSFFPVC